MPFLEPYDLRCEYAARPLGIDVARPRLSFKLRSDQRDQAQSAYQILVATSAEVLAADRGDLWDSGRVAYDRTTWIEYGGSALRYAQRAHWKVRSWDKSGNPGPWSTPAWWEMGLLARGQWTAQWIGTRLAGGPRTMSPCPYVRKSFRLDKPVASARLYATALGLYEPHLNGQRVGDHIFAPGWTEYRKRVQYQTYDVTGLLRQGENVLGAILGDGWYCGYLGADPRQRYGERPMLLAQLVITHDDGSTTRVVSDSSWRYNFGPLLESDLIMGESYDARRAMPGWDSPGFDDRAWLGAEVGADPGIALVASAGPPVRRIMEIRPVAPPRTFRKNWDRDGWIYDLGQNMVGRIRLNVRGPAGTTVTIRYAEILDAKQELYTANLRSARATDHYTLRGDPQGEVYEPQFTFHGFRYVEIDHPGGPPPAADAVTGIVLHSDTPMTGEFECSNPLVNQLQHNIQWGQRGNFLEVPTDCPQRDERLGWTGDAQVFVRTACFNASVDGFFAKWMQDLSDSQGEDGGVPPVIPSAFDVGGDGGPAWADATLICPWTIYQSFGDAGILQRHYETLVRFVNSLRDKRSRNLIRALPEMGWGGFGDWLSQDGVGENGWSGRTPTDLIGTAFFSHSARLLSRIAGVLGRSDDAAQYGRLADDVRSAFQRRYLTPDGLIVAQTQTACVLALHFDLVPQDRRNIVLGQLVSDIQKRGWRLSTGFVGSPYLNHVLTACGRLDVAYTLLNQKQWPSWLYAVTQGATTIWERWDGWTHDKGFQDPAMNSFNHYAYGAIGDWLYGVVAGIEIDPDRPAYKHIILRPMPGGGLTSARAAIESVHGRVSSDWRIEGEQLHWTIEVPPNTTATAWVPASDPQSILEGGQSPQRAGLKRIGEQGDRVLFAVPSGRYSISSRWAAPHESPVAAR